MKRRGVDGFHRQLFRREQRVGQGELVVNFVVGVGVENHARLAAGMAQTLDAEGVVKRGESHRLCLQNPVRRCVLRCLRAT